MQWVAGWIAVTSWTTLGICITSEQVQRPHTRGRLLRTKQRSKKTMASLFREVWVNGLLEGGLPAIWGLFLAGVLIDSGKWQPITGRTPDSSPARSPLGSSQRRSLKPVPRTTQRFPAPLDCVE